MRRIPVLDGVRGLAILLVLFHHFVLFANLEATGRFDHRLWLAAHGAWIGVDVFFVLSGFLITGILFDAKGSERYFRVFYGRRTLRIFPLYFAFLAVAALTAPLLVGRPLFGEGTMSPLWFLTYTSNVHHAFRGWEEPLLLGHFWSLAVEEQFYLLWPLVVFALDRRALMRTAVLCFFAAFAFRLAVTTVLPPVSGYVLMPARMDALAAGAFVALAVRGPRGWDVVGRRPVPVLFLSGAVIASIVWTTHGFFELHVPVRTWGYSAMALFAAAALAWAVTASEASAIRRLFESRPLKTLGVYSYGLYVFHQPIAMALSEHGLSAAVLPRVGGSQLPGVIAFSAVALVLSSLAAVASYHLWEMPFLRLKARLPYGGRGSTSVRAPESEEGGPAPPEPRAPMVPPVVPSFATTQDRRLRTGRHSVRDVPSADR